ncbi:uncharacterized protein IL334_004401 [Kwoniella shivajii]|uniref:Uncharacterized protein n=1 Tax=Kwoniella shivajii TaxID=564305 RepID=A0ABZ1D1Z6_9TREE|nr:hypothetical protein IL334_004401 [Kwoniella shivajii]
MSTLPGSHGYPSRSEEPSRNNPEIETSMAHYTVFVEKRTTKVAEIQSETLSKLVSEAYDRANRYNYVTGEAREQYLYTTLPNDITKTLTESMIQNLEVQRLTSELDEYHNVFSNMLLNGTEYSPNVTSALGKMSERLSAQYSMLKTARVENVKQMLQKMDFSHSTQDK